MQQLRSAPCCWRGVWSDGAVEAMPTLYLFYLYLYLYLYLHLGLSQSRNVIQCRLGVVLCGVVRDQERQNMPVYRDEATGGKQPEQT